ncbi:hypothetical protein SAMN04488074_1467 [Lentzea albidocapillata subsp. violacea]|uniref:Uncharacterized protein n=2 Tax=Lentzea albidocapillata TaxID=40571 RepID=A0A1H0AED0_9PSEU|nr:hypothetical protein SAMN04488074_1467 [Lentzea albidocapillata subsp. violacea]
MMRKIARVSLARVFAVLALVVGIALLQGAPCERDVVSTAQCTASSMQVFADPAAASDLLEDLGGVPEACLAALLAVLLAVAVLRLPGLVPVNFVSAPVPWQGSDRRPEVRLTQLCVLRT